MHVLRRAAAGVIPAAARLRPPSQHVRALAQLNTPYPPQSSSSRSVPHLKRPISQPTHFTHPHTIGADEVTPRISRAEYVARRAALAARLPPGSVALFGSNEQYYMSADVPYLYHANTDLLYLTGLSEQSSCLLAHRPRDGDASGESTTFTLFVRARDASTELWDGPCCGATPDVAAHFAVDAAQPLAELPAFVAKRLPAIQSFHFDARGSGTIAGALAALPSDARTQLLQCWKRDRSAKSFVNALRLHKSGAEIALLRDAARAMARGLNDAMAASFARVPERTIDALLRFGATTPGRDGAVAADRMAFPSVVAGGARACTLHYMRNDATVRDGEMVMVDAGCEVGGYVSDVSRSWPSNGRFSGAQRDLYALTLEVQRACIAALRVGDGVSLSLDDLHARAARDLTDGLRSLGFLRAHSTESALASGAYSRYFPHALGHYLGMDVHDTHEVAKSIPLKPGMVVTVEPGLYCAPDDTDAPEAFRGIGLRIEDDVVVGGPDGAPEVLSADAVKEIADVEALVGSAV